MKKPARRTSQPATGIPDAVANAPVMLFELDARGTVTLLAGGLAEQLGFHPQEAVGRSILEMHAGIPRAAELIKRALTGEVFCALTQVKGRSLEMCFSPRRDTKGRRNGITGWATDVTERQQSDAAREFGEQRFSTAFGITPFPMVISELDTAVAIDINTTFVEWTGYGRAESLGRSLKDLGIWPRPEQRDELVALVKAKGMVKDFPAQIRLKNGEVRETLFCSRAFTVAGRGYLINLCVDITDSLRAQESLRESEERFRHAFEFAGIGMALLSPDGRWLRVNRSICEILGYTEAELRQTTFQALTHPEDLPKNLDVSRRLLADDIPRMQAVKRYRHKDGHYVWANLNTSIVRSADGKPLYYVSQIEDITGRKQAEADRARLLEAERSARIEAETANKAKDDFLAIVSHELRTPLTAILGWSWLLRSGQLSEEERRNALDIIQRNTQNQRQIVEDLIDVSSLSQQNFSLSRSVLDLSALMESACESLGQLAQDRSIRLVRDLRGPAGVMADAGRLQQVFWNLLHNAMKFTPAGGEVRVSVRREGEQAVAEVQDSGSGISPEFLPHLFEPFRQGEDALIREHRGLGLGLAIVKRLVELHGGSVTARSSGAGRGAVFTVRLPAAAWPPPGRAADPPQAVPDAHSLDGLSVLVVEDEDDARALLGQLLSRYGARVEVAAGAAEAWEILQRSVPDLLLCDIAMPGEDGCAFMRRVRARGGKLGSMPAAALTALAREEDRARALTAGFQVYLTKPLEPPLIMEALRTLVGRRQSSRRRFRLPEDLGQG